MIKLLFTADWHLRGTNPRNRKDDYKEAVKAKLLEVFQMAELHEVDAIITPGDTWDTFLVSVGTLLEFVDFINENNRKPILTTFGQHDVQGYNAESLYRTSLALMLRLIPNMRLYTDPGKPINLSRNNTKVQLTFAPYTRRMDVQGYGYSPEGDAAISTDAYKIHVAHGTLLDHEPPFDKYTLIEDVVTNADLVLTGDYHPGYGLYKRHDGKVFYNPGSLTRLKASAAEIERKIRVGLITVSHMEATVQDLYLRSAKPGEEILDRSRIEAEAAREYSMSQFSMLMQNKLGDKVLLDVNQIIDVIAQQENAAPHIVKAALEVIDENRMKVKA